MAFTEVAWANGDYLTETKLDQMVANDVHLREEVAYHYVVQDASEGTVTNPAIPGATPSVSIEVDGASFGTGFSGAGEGVDHDINVSAVSTGLHELEVILTGAGSYTRKYRFYKTADMTYLTMWATLSTASDGGTGSTIGITDLTIIGHRQTKSWTV